MNVLPNAHNRRVRLVGAAKMRELRQDEMQKVLEKLAKFMGDNVKRLVEREDAEFCFRLIKNRVFYMPKDVEAFAHAFQKKQLFSSGTCLGRMTHSGKFQLTLSALPYLAAFAEYRVWLTPTGEQSFLYGNLVVKSTVQRMTELMPRGVGVVVMNAQNRPIGFGLSAKSTAEAERSSPLDVVVFRYADAGEFLRREEEVV